VCGKKEKEKEKEKEKGKRKRERLRRGLQHRSITILSGTGVHKGCHLYTYSFLLIQRVVYSLRRKISQIKGSVRVSCLTGLKILA